MPESLDSLIRRIKSLEIQGAKQIAVHSLKFLRIYTKKRGFGKDFKTAIKKLEKSRPTAVVLHNCLEILKKNPSQQTITKLLSQLNEATKEIGKRGHVVIKNNYKIMTHCHSGEALSVIKQAWKEGKKITVYATETRPKYQGIITAKELSKLGIPTILITDSAAGYYMDKVDALIVGTDAIRKEGVVNKIGTYMMALTAYQHKKPIYFVGNTLKLDKRKKIIIEMRSEDEVYRKIKGVEIENPAFDITPWKYVTRIITEKGVMTKANLLRLMK